MWWAIACGISFFVCFANGDLATELSCGFSNGEANDGLCNYHQNSQVPLVVENSLQFADILSSLVSQPVLLSGVHCLKLDYFLLSTKAFIGIHAQRIERSRQINVFGVHPTQDYNLFSRNERSSIIDRWQHYEKTINFRPANYTVHIDGKTTVTGGAKIANLKFSEGACPVNADEKSCDFDAVVGGAYYDNDIHCVWMTAVHARDTPGWHGYFWQVTSSDERIIQPSNPIRFMEGDHSTRFAYGGFLTVTAGQQDPQLLLNEFHPGDGYHCFTFWIRGQQHESRVIEVAIETNVTNILLDTSEYRERFQDWQRKQVTIDPVVNMLVKFVVVSGFVKLDSMTLERGKCPEPLSCDFKDDMCGWTDWITLFNRSKLFIGDGRLLGDSPEGASENEDYNQTYLYADLTSDRHRVQIESESVKLEGDWCFWFEFTSDSPGGVHVKSKSGHLTASQIGLGVDELRLEIVNNTGIWKTGYVDIKQSDVFRILIAHDFVNGSRIFRIRKTRLERGSCRQLKNGPLPLAIYQDVNFHCYRTGHYIPKYRSCDGVVDCPMGEDEGEQCSQNNCAGAGIPCKRRGHRFCLMNHDEFCDGIANCDDAIDEDPRFCNRESFCENYCLAGGFCNFDQFKCNCPTLLNGKRCT